MGDSLLPRFVGELSPSAAAQFAVSRFHAMRDFHAFRRSAVKYWERRRVIYNAALVLPALFGYMVTAGLAYVGDPHPTHYRFLLLWFGLSVIGGNVCYSFAYALEFIFGSDDPTSHWLRCGRPTAFVGGVLFAMLVALIAGRNIAMMEFYEQSEHVMSANHPVAANSPTALSGQARCGWRGVAGRNRWA